MELKGQNFENCRSCNKAYAANPFLRSKYCPTCEDTYESKYKTVREYLYDHRGSSAVQIAEATGIPVELILDFIADERFTTD